jgi:hypothetical protein
MRSIKRGAPNLLASQETNQSLAPCPVHHAYSLAAIGMTLQMVLNSALSFRACSLVVNLLQDYLPQFRGVPAPNTVESWLLRLGLHELQRPKEKANDWVLMIDHTLQLGARKCLLIVGIRQSVWEQLDEPLTHKDLTMLALEPVEKSDGVQVNRQLEAVVKQIGTPMAVLSDEGSDLINGAARFQEKHAETLVLNDIAHKAAVFLKRELLADPRWEAFVKQCGQTQPKVKQTELGHLAPPTLKVKARYMNLGPLICWGAKMLRLVEAAPAERPADLDLTRLEDKFGWVRDFRTALVDWNDLTAVKDCVLEYARIEGYHADASEELRRKLRSVASTPTGKRLATALIEFVQEQSQGGTAGLSLPASSEVLESLIGKGKRLQGQHSRGGFTKLILGMAASVVQITHERVCQALETISTADLTTWCQEFLGCSLTAQRRKALPARTGT